jgi:hypothetical protein
LAVHQRSEHTGMAQVEPHFRKARKPQRVQHQLLDLDVGLEAAMTVDFRADLNLLTRRVQPTGTRMQHVSGVAQPRHALAIEQMGIDACHLRRHVGTQTQRAARQLVHELERAQVQIAAGARQKRLDIFEQRRHDHLVAIRAEAVQQAAPQLFDLARLGGQHVGDILGK